MGTSSFYKAGKLPVCIHEQNDGKMATKLAISISEISAAV